MIWVEQYCWIDFVGFYCTCNVFIIFFIYLDFIYFLFRINITRYQNQHLGNSGLSIYLDSIYTIILVCTYLSYTACVHSLLLILFQLFCHQMYVSFVLFVVLLLISTIVRNKRFQIIHLSKLVIQDILILFC